MPSENVASRSAVYEKKEKPFASIYFPMNVSYVTSSLRSYEKKVWPLPLEITASDH